MLDDLPINRRTQDLAQRASQAKADLTALQAAFDQQHLILQTLLMLLLEKKVIEEQEFRDWIAYVDGLDGRRDGKIAALARPTTCPGCKRISAPNAIACQYCGHAFSPDFLARRKPE